MTQASASFGDDFLAIEKAGLKRRRPRGLRTLFVPLQESEILVRDEVVLYKERKHWFSLAEPVFTAFVLICALAIITFGLVPTTSFGVAFVGFTFVFAIWFTHRKIKDWSKPALYTLGVLAFFAFTEAALDSLAFLAMAVILLKLFFELSRAYWRTMYLTNRRVLMAESPWSRDISSVALGRITDISIHQTHTGGFFGYSHLKVETAGQDQALKHVDFLRYPDDFYQSLITLSTGEANLEKFFKSEDDA